MRVLPPVVTAVSVPCLLTAACLLGTTGCSSFDKSLGQQDALVSFTPSAPTAVRLQVRSACGRLPDVKPEPIDKSVPLSEALGQVVFRIDNAGTTEITRLDECVQKYPQVSGFEVQDSSDDS